MRRGFRQPAAVRTFDPGGNMESVSRHIVRHAQDLAREVGARALVVYADAMTCDDDLRQVLAAVDSPVILVTRSHETTPLPCFESRTWVSVPDVPMTRA